MKLPGLQLFLLPAVPVVALFLMTASIRAQGNPVHSNAVEREIDPAIAAQIARIKATDNHAHPVLPPPADATDREFDALPVDNMEAETDTVAWTAANPQLPAAWKALYEFSGVVPLDAEGMKRLATARELVKAREGQHYAEWVLDRAGIGTMLANRVAMGAGIGERRFRWVPYADALLLPLDNSGIAAATPDKALFFPMDRSSEGSEQHDAHVHRTDAVAQQVKIYRLSPTNVPYCFH